MKPKINKHSPSEDDPGFEAFVSDASKMLVKLWKERGGQKLTAQDIEFLEDQLVVTFYGMLEFT